MTEPIAGVKYDDGKPRWDLLDLNVVEQIVKVLTYGAKKYPEPDNWKRVPDMDARYEAATMRHLAARQKGELLDPETGLPHLAHAACCILFRMWSDEQKVCTEPKDNTPKELTEAYTKCFVCENRVPYSTTFPYVNGRVCPGCNILIHPELKHEDGINICAKCGTHFGGDIRSLSLCPKCANNSSYVNVKCSCGREYQTSNFAFSICPDCYEACWFK